MVPALCSMRTALLSRHFCPSILTRNGGFRATHKPLCRRLHVATGAFRAPSQAMAGSAVEQEKLASALLDKLRARQAKDAWNTSKKEQRDVKEAPKEEEAALDTNVLPTSFEELGLTEELMAAVRELKISEPTEVQRLAIPAVLDGQDVVIASHTGSGKTLAYMLPLVQALRMDEAETGMIVKSKKPRAIVLCPTRELAEQVLQVAKSISHHARFRSTMISGGFRLRPQTDALNAALDVVVGTPGRLLMHIEEGNMAFRDVKYVVLDEADTMFDRGFGPEVKKFLGPLRNRVSQGGGDFQTVLVTATITKAIQELLDDEFPGIRHIHTSTLHKKVDTSRHHFVKVPGNENKIEALLQVLEPALAKGNHVMVFCNTVASCRAVDHFLNEVNVPCVNYHGEVPAEDRVENLKKFKSGDAAEGPVPALVCTDLAARGLDLVVDHVIMFDFPHNSIDYLHRTGRTARMGAKGKVTSLVTKRDLTLAGRLETAMSRGETLEAVSATREKLLAAKQHEFKVKQKEAFERAAGRGVYLDKPGTKALALAKTKVHRLLGNQPRPKRTVKKGTAGKFGKPKSRAKPVGKARKQRA